MGKEKSKTHQSTLSKDTNHSQNAVGNLVNPTVVKTINILDTSKAIILSNGVPPKPKPKATPKVVVVQEESAKSKPILKSLTESQNLLRYHLVGDHGWKTVFGFRLDTSTQPIHIVKDSKIHSLVISSPDGIIPRCVIRIHCTNNDETKIITISFKEQVNGTHILTPGELTPFVEWSEDVTFTKGSTLAVRIEEENSLDIELYLQ